MKRTERHHLKENELAAWVADARGRLLGHTRMLIAVAVTFAVIAGAAGGFLIWRARTDAAAAMRLADAARVMDAPVVPPPPAAGTAPPAVPGSYPSTAARLEAALKAFLEVADQYPRSQAGRAARYQAASALTSLGRFEEAERQYQQVLDGDRGGLYGQMAELGLAEAASRAGHHDRAIELFRQASARSETQLPVDAILLQLGQAYLAAGKPTEAHQTFTKIVDEFPQSLYVSDAKRELGKLAGG